jgi:hypothetical protein
MHERARGGVQLWEEIPWMTQWYCIKPKRGRRRVRTSSKDTRISLELAPPCGRGEKLFYFLKIKYKSENWV